MGVPRRWSRYRRLPKTGNGYPLPGRSTWGRVHGAFCEYEPKPIRRSSGIRMPRTLDESLLCSERAEAFDGFWIGRTTFQRSGLLSPDACLNGGIVNVDAHADDRRPDDDERGEDEKCSLVPHDLRDLHGMTGFPTSRRSCPRRLRLSSAERDERCIVHRDPSLSLTAYRPRRFNSHAFALFASGVMVHSPLPRDVPGEPAFLRNETLQKKVNANSRQW